VKDETTSNSNDHDATPHDDIDADEARTAAFAAALAPVDRTAALRAGRTPVPPKFIMWVVVAFAVLGIGGALGDHFFGNLGANTPIVAASTTTSVAATSRAPLSLNDFIGLKLISSVRETGFVLRDQANANWRLADAKGQVVVLSFANENCNDVCPVLGRELLDARSLLGALASRVVFAIVNTDPYHLAVTARPTALVTTHLLGVPQVYFLTGTLKTLNSIWNNYGVTVKVGAKSSQVAHNNVIYFIDAQGNLQALAVPFGARTSSGSYTLSAANTVRFAKGIAQVASSLFR
jgi:cytochrome oxidase Cu insertion factor (SCO1/SenC/PrrC family)